MLHKYRFWLTAFPDINRPIGGIKQIHRLAESLNILGHEATIVQEDENFVPGWFQSSVSTISKADWLKINCLDSQVDIIIMPETFLSVVSAYHPHIKKIIFNQNGSYTFGLNGVNEWNPSSVIKGYNHPSIHKVWCVSQYDYDLLSLIVTNHVKKVGLIANGLEPICNIPKDSIKKYQICYMPRKNSRDSSIVSSLLKSQSWFHGWYLHPIQNLRHKQVIEVFQQSLIFLSFGHPEGFGLPVAEAMACGCAVVGYSGLGGRELFQLAEHHQLGIPVEFGDWIGFLIGVRSIIHSFNQFPSVHIANAHKLSSDILLSYGFDSMIKSVDNVLSDLYLD